MTEELAYLVYRLDAYCKGMGSSQKRLLKKLKALKETLVITSGDNYVGSAEPQLREKIADLYAKLASSYDVPSQAEMDNLAALEKRFERAKTDFEKLEGKIKSSSVELKSFEDFLDS